MTGTLAEIRRILIVDDNADASEMLAAMLEIGGYEMRIAHDGVEGVAAAREFSPDVIFLDIGMPGMDGFEVVKVLRDDPLLERTVIVALTGWSSSEDKKKTFEAGFHHHLAKPIKTSAVDQLLARIKGEHDRA